MISTNTSARATTQAVESEASPADIKPRVLGLGRGARQTELPPLRKSHRDLERPPFECIALVLQGGGALGAFQAGVYQGLVEAGLHPDWVSGISIGAINAALIAGNAPKQRLDKLHAFWDQVSQPQDPDFFELANSWWRGDLARGFLNRLKAGGTLFRGAPGFFSPRIPPPYLRAPARSRRRAGTTPRRCASTLERLVDFDRINCGEMRFSVGAVNVRTGNFAYFDSTTHKIRPEHVMASGSLPPGFPADRDRR